MMFRLPNLQRHRFAKPVRLLTAALTLASLAVAALSACASSSNPKANANQGGTGVWGPSGCCMTHGPGDGEIMALAIDPMTAPTVYASTGWSVFKSTDAGMSWRAISAGLRDNHVWSLAVDSRTPSIVYAGTELGVFKSTNAGASWRATKARRPIEFVTTLAINPRKSAIIYAGTLYGDVFRSTNGGSGWRAMKAGLRVNGVRVLVIDPRTPSILYAGSNGSDDPDEPGDGVFKSTNGGRSWRAMKAGLGHNTTVSALAIDPQTPTTLYAAADGRVFKTTDGGRSWRATSLALADEEFVSALAIDPRTPSTLYVATSSGDITVIAGGVFRSVDAGATWRPFNQGLRPRNVRALAIAPTGNVLYAGTQGGGVLDYRFSG